MRETMCAAWWRCSGGAVVGAVRVVVPKRMERRRAAATGVVCAASETEPVAAAALHLVARAGILFDPCGAARALLGIGAKRRLHGLRRRIGRAAVGVGASRAAVRVGEASAAAEHFAARAPHVGDGGRVGLLPDVLTPGGRADHELVGIAGDEGEQGEAMVAAHAAVCGGGAAKMQKCAQTMGRTTADMGRAACDTHATTDKAQSTGFPAASNPPRHEKGEHSEPSMTECSGHRGCEQRHRYTLRQSTRNATGATEPPAHTDRVALRAA